jgi:uncharacterized protein YcfL
MDLLDQFTSSTVYRCPCFRASVHAPCLLFWYCHHGLEMENLEGWAPVVVDVLRAVSSYLTR